MASEVRVWLNEAAVVGPKIVGMLVRSLGGGWGGREGGTEPGHSCGCCLLGLLRVFTGELQLPPNADACAFESPRSCHSLDVTWWIC